MVYISVLYVHKLDQRHDWSQIFFISHIIYIIYRTYFIVLYNINYKILYKMSSIILSKEKWF